MKATIISFILLFISISLYAQQKEKSIEIVFKPKSTKLSKVEKEKIRKFVEALKIDSNYVFCIELINEGCNKKKYISWDRVSSVIKFMNGIKKAHESIFFNSISKQNIDIIKLSYIDKKSVPTHGVPPFTKLRK